MAKAKVRAKVCKLCNGTLEVQCPKCDGGHGECQSCEGTSCDSAHVPVHALTTGVAPAEALGIVECDECDGSGVRECEVCC